MNAPWSLSEGEVIGLVLFAFVAFALLSSRSKPRKTGINLLRFAAVEGAPVCPECLAPYAAGDRFCGSCRTPLSMFAVTSPLETTLAEGELFRRSVRRPTKLALAGLFLLAVPGIVCLAIAVHPRGDRELLVSGAFGGLFYLMIAMRALEERRKAMRKDEPKAGES